MKDVKVVSMTIPELAFVAQVSRAESGDTYGPRSFSTCNIRVPSDNKAEVKAFLSAQNIDFAFFVVVRRWVITLTTSHGQTHELMSESVR